MSKQLRAAVLGASGYTGAETIRLLAHHPQVAVRAVSANALSGRDIADVFPHLSRVCDLRLQPATDINWDSVDVAFSCLPHGASQDILLDLPNSIRIIDLSADFRFRDADVYARTYGRSHIAPDRAAKAVYGLTELTRHLLADADVIACPGCYPTASLLALLPLLQAEAIEAADIVIDAKSGVSGAGRGLKEGNLFSEAAEGLHPYSVGSHRHAPEIEQEIALVVGKYHPVSFTPHLVPMTRGELVTVYVRFNGGSNAEDLHSLLGERYVEERFVHVKPFGSQPADTRHVRGTNDCVISVHADRVPGRAIIVAVIDNLVKGSGGQAIQNLNAAMGWDESLGLDHLTPLFP